MSETHYRACHLCEAICGLAIEVTDGAITSIRGDDKDPLSRGHICPKAVALQDLHEDPDRLRAPVKRISDDNGNTHWEEISWQEALDTCAEKLMECYHQHGVHAIGAYFGNPSVHNYGMLTHQRALFGHIRTNNRYSATSVDQLPHHLASLWLFGHKSLLPVPDIDRTDYFLMLGANPLASNGSLWTVPDVQKRIKALRTRGGKLVVIDPCHTRTAQLASEHHFIRPGTDALLLAALLNTIFAEGLADPGHLAEFTTGLDTVESSLRAFTPDLVSDHCGIDAEIIRGIARDLAGAEAGICYGRMGLSTQRFGALCQWLIQLINIATGNLDKPGGSLFSTLAVDQVANGSPGGFDRFRSRVRGLPEFDRELPSAALAEEILTEGEGQVRALFTGAGNPVLSTPNGKQLEEALPTLEFMVSVDPFINETTCHADIILPPSSPLEHDHYDLAFHGLAIRNTTRMNEAIFEKPEGALHDWEIFNELGKRVARILGAESMELPAPDQIIDFGLQMGPFGAAHNSETALDLARLRKHPSGIDLGPLQSQLPERLFTAGKTIACDRPEAIADLDRLRASLDEPAAEMLLIGRRHVRSNNSWMHNYQRLVKGKERCTALLHPGDMEARGIIEGQEITVSSRVGSISLAAQASEDMMPGVISIPHGWGHDRPGIRLGIASDHAGVSCNDITDNEWLDELSGNAAVNGVPVSVRASGTTRA